VFGVTTHKPTSGNIKAENCALSEKRGFTPLSCHFIARGKEETMTIDKQRRVETAKLQNAMLDKLISLIKDYQVENLHHAKSNSESDYLDLLVVEYKMAENIGSSLHWDTWEQQVLIADELRSECSFDILEQAYIDENGDIISDGGLPTGLSLADYLYDEKRDQET
jgi:hypothetical protein